MSTRCLFKGAFNKELIVCKLNELLMMLKASKKLVNREGEFGPSVLDPQINGKLMLKLSKHALG